MRRILIVSDIPFFPPNEGSRKRVHDLVESYLQLGAEVTFLLIDGAGDIDSMREKVGGNLYVCHRTLREKLSILLRRVIRFGAGLVHIDRLRNYPLDSWKSSHAQEMVGELCLEKEFDIVQIEYLYLSHCFKAVGTVPIKILDTLDVMSDRWRMFPADETPNVWYSVDRSAELEGCLRANKVFAISSKDKSYFEELGCARVQLCDFTSPPRSIWSPESKKVVFLGSDNRMNRSGLRWFVEMVLPLVLNDAPDFRVHIAGKIANQVSNARGIVKVGEFDSLDELFSNCKFMINSVSVGTGLAIKNLDALSRGVPIVCTPNAARGAELFFGKGVVICNDAAGFSASIVDLWRNDALLELHSSQLVRTYQEAFDESRKCIANSIGLNSDQ